MLFYIWRAQYPLFMVYHAMLVDGTGSGGELPPEKADRILVRPWHTQRQPLGKGCDEPAPLSLCPLRPHVPPASCMTAGRLRPRISEVAAQQWCRSMQGMRVEARNLWDSS